MVWTRLRGAVAVLAVAGLASCSSGSDDSSPGGLASGASDWVSSLFNGTAAPPPTDVPSAPPADEPKLGNDERPKATPAAEKAKIVDSLVADRANAKYTEAEQKREGNPTRPLSGETDAAVTTPAPKTEAPAAEPGPAKQAEPTKASEPTPAPAPETAPDAAPTPAPEKKTLKSSSADTAKPTQTAEAAADTDSVVAPSARVKLDDPATSTKPVAKAEAKAAPEPAPKQAAAPQPAPAQQQVAAAQPAPAASVSAPAPRPRATAANGDLVASTYRQRLAEFSAGPPAATQASYAEPSNTTRRGDAAVSDTGAMPNSKVTAAHGSGGAHPLTALDQNKAAASFQVAEIAFGEGTAALAPDSEANLHAVADVYRTSKGAARIGIIGHSNSSRLDVSASANRDANRSLAAERAAAVARALEKMGVPSGKIYAGATGETAGDYAEVFASY